MEAEGVECCIGFFCVLAHIQHIALFQHCLWFGRLGVGAAYLVKVLQSQLNILAGGWLQIQHAQYGVPFGICDGSNNNDPAILRCFPNHAAAAAFQHKRRFFQHVRNLADHIQRHFWVLTHDAPDLIAYHHNAFVLYTDALQCVTGCAKGKHLAGISPFLIPLGNLAVKIRVNAVGIHLLVSKHRIAVAGERFVRLPFFGSVTHALRGIPRFLFSGSVIVQLCGGPAVSVIPTFGIPLRHVVVVQCLFADAVLLRTFKQCRLLLVRFIVSVFVGILGNPGVVLFQRLYFSPCIAHTFCLDVWVLLQPLCPIFRVGTTCKAFLGLDPVLYLVQHRPLQVITVGIAQPVTQQQTIQPAHGPVHALAKVLKTHGQRLQVRVLLVQLGRFQVVPQYLPTAICSALVFFVKLLQALRLLIGQCTVQHLVHQALVLTIRRVTQLQPIVTLAVPHSLAVVNLKAPLIVRPAEPPGFFTDRFGVLAVKFHLLCPVQVVIVSLCRLGTGITVFFSASARCRGGLCLLYLCTRLQTALGFPSGILPGILQRTHVLVNHCLALFQHIRLFRNLPSFSGSFRRVAAHQQIPQLLHQRFQHIAHRLQNAALLCGGVGVALGNILQKAACAVIGAHDAAQYIAGSFIGAQGVVAIAGLILPQRAAHNTALLGIKAQCCIAQIAHLFRRIAAYVVCQLMHQCLVGIAAVFA